MVGPGKPIDTRSLVRDLREFARQLQGLDRPGVDRSRRPASRIASTSPTCRSRTSPTPPSHVVQRARHRAARLRHRQLDGRHDRAGVPAAASGRRARATSTSPAAPQALPFSIAIRSLQREAIRLDPHWNHGDYDDDALPGQRHAHGAQARRGHLPLGAGMGRPLRPRAPGSDDREDDEPFGLEFQVESLPRRPRAPLRAPASTRTATSTCRARWTGSTSPNTATATSMAGLARDPRRAARCRSAWRPTSCSRCSSRSRSPTACAPAAPTSSSCPALAAGPRRVPGRYRAFRAGDRAASSATAVRHSPGRCGRLRCWPRSAAATAHARPSISPAPTSSSPRSTTPSRRPTTTTITDRAARRRCAA